MKRNENQQQVDGLQRRRGVRHGFSVHKFTNLVNIRLVVRKGHPQADRPSRPAIGAAVTVHLPDGRRLVSQVDGGSGHSGKRAPDIHLGLGQVAASTLLNVDVRWRGADGKLRSQTLQLTPGWHTVWLGQEASSEKEGIRH
jgi:hypothetical protein